MAISIIAEGLAKSFSGRNVFKDIRLSVNAPGSLAVTGPNGSGKSTLLEIIAGIRKPDKGKLVYESGGIATCLSDIGIGFSSLRINPYGELTAIENMEFVCDRKSREKPDEHLMICSTDSAFILRETSL